MYLRPLSVAPLSDVIALIARHVAFCLSPERRNDEWSRGYEAFHLKQYRTHCPYSDPEKSSEWLAGFDAAASYPNEPAQ